MKAGRLAWAAGLAVAIGAPIMAYETGRTGAGGFLAGEPLLRIATVGEFPSLGGANGWLNSPPLTPASLRGKVVVVDFWTYSCINWRRQLPYVRAWSDKYRDQGLVVIGVHTPEFEFEKNVDHIRWAVKDMNVGYPVAIDSDYEIWRAFRNQYWPALYFIDAKGRVRHQQFGEGEYAESERVIQKLLAEAGTGGDVRGLVSVEGKGAEAAPDNANLRSPETYVGNGRGDFASSGGALSGNWTVTREFAVSNKEGARIALRFHARDLHLVMGPKDPAKPVRFRVLIDGKPPGASHGVDVDAQGNGTMTRPQMFQLIRQARPIAGRLFEIEFLDPGAQAFSFTFG